MGRIITSNDPVYLQLGISSSQTSDEQNITTAAIKWAESAVRRYLKYDPVQLERTEYYPNLNQSAHYPPSIWEADSSKAYLRYQQSGLTNELPLRHLPVRSISALYIDYDGRFGKQSGAFATETLKTEGSDFWARYDGQDDAGNLICRDGILISHGQWPIEPGCVKIVYTAGYSADELEGNGILVDAHPIYEAVLFEATRKAKQTLMLSKNQGDASGSTGWSAGSIQSEKLGDYSYTLSSSSGSSGGAGGGLYDGVRDLSSESMERLADFVNIGYSLIG